MHKEKGGNIMLKRFMALSASLLLVGGLLVSCGGNSTNNTANNTGGTAGAGNTPTDSAKPVTINMFTASPEYTDAFNAYIAEYKKVKPNVTINLEIMQADYNTVLKSKIAVNATGCVPDYGGRGYRYFCRIQCRSYQ